MKKVLLILAILASALLIMCLGINVVMRSVSAPYMLSIEAAASLNADCILVLGAGVWEGGRLSPILEDRVKTGLQLYKNGVSDRLLMSGDHGREEYDEVNAMKGYALENGASDAHVFMDHAGFSTYESMVRAKEVFRARKIVIVTQEFHLYRAIYIARALGLDAYGVQADLRRYAGQTYTELRESAARVKDFFYAVFQPAPTYLGEAIPVSGDGTLTNDAKQ